MEFLDKIREKNKARAGKVAEERKRDILAAATISATEDFNLVCEDGVHYIAYKGIIVSTAADADNPSALLCRLKEYRDKYTSKLFADGIRGL